jgi:hypothetical protein
MDHYGRSEGVARGAGIDIPGKVVKKGTTRRQGLSFGLMVQRRRSRDPALNCQQHTSTSAAGDGTWRSGGGDGDGITEEKEARISNPRNVVKDARI